MALNAYLRLKSETQGDIKGSVTLRGQEDSIMVIAVNHEVISPVDPVSGLPAGRRQHGPLVITKEIDRSSPLLMNALVNSEKITEFALRFWRPSRSGPEVQFYTIHLMDAHITGIRSEMLNNKYPENAQHREREHVSFCYQRIEWIWEDGGISAQDNL